MKIFLTQKRAEAGNVFLVALGLTAVISVTLASYLTLVQGQADSVYRSQNYNSVIPIAEAGTEEALEFINSVGWTNNLVSNGWSTLTASNTTSRSNFVTGTQYYVVTISNTPSGNPVIYSTGIVPYLQHAWAAAMLTNTTVTGTSNVTLARTIQVQTRANGLFKYALAAQYSIAFAGAADIDSFDSSSALLSTNGLYTPSMRDDHAIVASDSQGIFANGGLGRVAIRGSVNTGTNGTISSTGSYCIGDNAWVSNGTSGIELSRSNDNFNVSFPDIGPPNATFTEVASPGLVNGTNYDLVFYGNQYWGSSNVIYQGDIFFDWSQTALVTNGSVILYIPPGNNFQIAGNASFYIAPGSQLTIYCGAFGANFSSASFLGETNANQLTFYGLPTCFDVHLISVAGSAFTGVIYAPESSLRVRGAANIIGAITARTIAFRSSVSLHYDENLVNAGPTTGYAPTNWQEIPTPLALLGP
jgi:hypothetical protein